MRTLLQITVAMTISISGIIFGAANESYSTSEEKRDSVIIKCEPNVEKCILVVANDLKILMTPKSPDIISDLSLSPTQLISVNIEPDLQNNMPDVFGIIPDEYKKKLVMAIIIKHRGKLNIDSI